jgi:hypothetical protein
VKNPIVFDQWVNDNNPPEGKNFSKGWWDHVEDIRRLAYTTEPDRIEVIGELTILTPPPQEELILPVVRLVYAKYQIEVALDFSVSGFYPQFMVGFEFLGDDELPILNDKKSRIELFFRDLVSHDPGYRHLGLRDPDELIKTLRNRFSDLPFRSFCDDTTTDPSTSIFEKYFPVWCNEALFYLSFSTKMTTKI